MTVMKLLPKWNQKVPVCEFPRLIAQASVTYVELMNAYLLVPKTVYTHNQADIAS